MNSWTRNVRCAGEWRRWCGDGEPKPNPERPPVHFLDRALTASLEQHNEAVWKRLEDKCHGLSEARARLQEGGYGICRACGCRIPHRRLHALPAATLCVSCQAKRERACGDA